MSRLLIILITSLFALSSCASESHQDKSNAGARIPAKTAVQQEQKPEPETIPEDTLPLDTFPIEMLLGQLRPAKDTSFVPIAQRYTTKSNIYMRKAAYEAFLKMHAAAKAEGVDLKIISACRPFNSQKGIWERKWTGATRVEGQNLATEVPDTRERALKILRFSSMPGTSRHHWGTDIDLNNLNNSWFEQGQGKKVYEWLSTHAHEYGFCQPYSPMGEERPYGYQEERWHWSYMPLASKYLKAYLHQVDYSNINGFKGSESAEQIEVIKHYVAGIARTCLEW